MKDLVKVKRGKKNRKAGSAFEGKVRADLEKRGFIVIKNPNTVVENKFTQGKNKYNPFTKRLMAFGGFPDFVVYRPLRLTRVVGVECKLGKYLDREEKEKCSWLLDNHVFDKIFVATKGKDKKVDYIKFYAGI